MIFLGFLFASLAAVNAQSYAPRATPERHVGHPSSSPSNPKSNTVIENKNVNIIVNVDPKDVAKELWQLIQGRLDVRQGRRSDDSTHTINELERIITPMVAPTRRSHRPTAFEVAYSLDHVTRKALLKDHLTRPTIDDEIVTRDVVARMLVKLKSVMETENAPVYKLDDSSPAFRSLRDMGDDRSQENDSKFDDDDQYINVNLKIRKSELLRRSDTI